MTFLCPRYLWTECPDDNFSSVSMQPNFFLVSIILEMKTHLENVAWECHFIASPKWGYDVIT